MMDVSGIRVLVDLLTLAHLHTSRAVVPLQVICHYLQKSIRIILVSDRHFPKRKPPEIANLSKF